VAGLRPPDADTINKHVNAMVEVRITRSFTAKEGERGLRK
jgi:hypothetical protein